MRVAVSAARSSLSSRITAPAKPVFTVEHVRKASRRMLHSLVVMLQTLPPFVYLIPLIFLFSVTEPKLYGIAIILYAIVPVVRLTNLGILLRDRGQAHTAEPLLRRAHNGLEAALGATHQLTLCAKVALALLLAQRAPRLRRGVIDLCFPFLSPNQWFPIGL